MSSRSSRRARGLVRGAARRLGGPRLRLPVRADRAARRCSASTRTSTARSRSRAGRSHWYGQVFGDYQIKDALYDDAQGRAEVTLVATIVGTAAAFPLVRSRLPFRSGDPDRDDAADHDPGPADRRQPAGAAHERLPLRSSPTQTAVIGQAVYTTPFVLLLVAARLQGFDPALERAASDLGANTFNRLRYVVLPLIMPAVFAGALFAFTLSLDEFIITLFLIGGAQHAADLHLHAGQVRDHARGERAREPAARRVAAADRARVRAAGALRTRCAGRAASARPRAT